MHLLLVAGGSGWHVSDLARAAHAHGHSTEVVDFRTLSSAHLTAWTNAPERPVVIVRAMPPGSLEQVVFRMDWLHRAQAAGVRVLNTPAALETCIDKYLTTAKLAAAGLPVPPTWVGQRAEEALTAFAELGGDVVVKPLFGSEGRGMVRLSDPDLAWRTLRTLERTQCVLYLQQFVAHPGYDVRVFVLGGRVLAAMRRYAPAPHWRTNVAQGGRGQAVVPTAAEIDLALRAAAVVGAEMAGVDLLPGPDGRLVVLEVNAVPGWRALAPVVGRDVAADLVRYAVGGLPAERADR
jgi:ribosomal protein S6--L-glutamate ligase